MEKGALGTNQTDAGLLFTGGKAAQSIQGPWDVSNITAAGANVDDFDMFVPPGEHGPARIGGFAQGYMVGSPVKGAAFDALGEFFNWFIAPEQSRKHCYDGGTATIDGVPSSNALAVKALSITQHNKVYLIQDEALGTSLANSYFALQQGVLAGSTSPKAAAAKMQDAIGKHLKAHA